MRPIARLLGCVVVAILWTVISAGSALACTGENATLEGAFRDSRSIYFARIEHARASSIGFYELTLDVGRIVRGQAKTHVTKLISAEVCESLEVGNSGIVVLGSVDPFGGGPTDTYNFFFVVAPGRTSQADVAAALSDTPATDTTPAAPDTSWSPFSLDLAMIGVGSWVFGLVLRRSGHRTTFPPPRQRT
jgi:hypothetical protein